ncbi:SLBB domain-containing protein [candidate division KSB1 bacterium]
MGQVQRDTLILRSWEEFVAPPVPPGEEVIPEEALAGVKERTRLTFEGESGVFADSILIGSIGDSLIYQVILKPLPRELKRFGEEIFIDTLAAAVPDSVFALPNVGLHVPIPSDFVIGPADSLTLVLWGRVDGQYGLRVNHEGNVFIPQVGEIRAWGLTLSQLEARIRKRLSRVFTDFEMSLVLGKIRSIHVYVMGEVNRPDAYIVPALYTAFNVLHLAGGPNSRGSFREVNIVRGGKVLTSYDLYDFLLKGDRREDIKLQSEDVIHVPLSKIGISVRGEVKRPGIYNLKGGERILEVVELAGGWTPKAHLGRVMIDRVIRNQGREIIDLDLTGENDQNNILIMDQDDISIFPIYPRREDVVWIQGAVKYPGAYRCQAGMRVSDLVLNRGQLLDEVFMDRADLIHKLPEGTNQVIPINLERALDRDPAYDIELKSGDRLTVYSYWDKNRKKFVSITGEIRNPGRYELREHYHLSDLLFEAGPVLRSAYQLKAEVARLRPGQPDSILTTSIEVLSNGDGDGSDILLEEDDYVFIRRIPEWQLHSLVSIEGEVRFPGYYPLESRQETLSQLIERAGGFTDKAFMQGALFVRPAITDEIERQNLRDIIMRVTQEAVLTDTLGWQVRQGLMDELEAKKIQRIVIDLETLWNNRHNQGNHDQVILEAGDRIFIPSIPTGVHVLGGVASTGTIKYQPNQDYRYYVDSCGGFTENANRKRVRVVKAGGQVLDRNLRKMKLEAGDTIIVPTVILRDVEWLPLVSNVVQIITGVGTSLFIITRLGK